MITLACCIIMLHSFVPHHHHDCSCEPGFVFENELACHCNDEGCCDDPAHHHHSQHPFDVCKLQELLSQLVLNTKEDKSFFFQPHQLTLPDLYAACLSCSAAVSPVRCCSNISWQCFHAAVPVSPTLLSPALRAPPSC